MKKVINMLVLCMLFIFLFPAYGCDGGFKAVSKVTYTTNGEQKKAESSCVVYYSAPMEEISLDEYSRAPQDRKISGSNEYRILYTLPKGIGNELSYKVVEKKLNGDYYMSVYDMYWHTKPYYYRVRYSYTLYTIVKVKVINDTTIVIKTSSGETTYTVTSYSANYIE